MRISSMKHAKTVTLLLALLAACNGSKTTDHAPVADASSAAAVEGKGLPAEADRTKVPGFDGATAWLNVDHALTPQDLAGHVTVVDFWTSCCINCIQTLPTLAAIEDKFANDGLVVVGVHSPKFDAETERARLTEAIAQYSIRHPVAVDGSMKIWNAWGVNAWPTVVVLDTKGRAVWVGSGEPNADELSSVITSALAEGKKNGTLVTTKIAGISAEKDDTGPLAFPG
ncbi:MAG TPA: thioredoxin-like domain-containing protein, partial [Polyangiaceae bacterium]